MDPSFDLAKKLESSQDDTQIVVKGARIHNLKSVDVTIPRDQLVVITGPSGSGKSSLAFDTIYAEGQRRYVESLSVYARQFLEMMAKPELESISGLSPTISIEQGLASYNPRSTVGTVTEIYDYLRLLYSRAAEVRCYSCGKGIQSQTPSRIVESILSLPEGTKISILAPIVRGRKGHYQKEFYQLRQKGFVRVKVDGELMDLSDEIQLDRQKKHDISVYVDRIVIKPSDTAQTQRIAESVDLALKLADRQISLELKKPGEPETELLFSEALTCTTCGISYPKLEPRIFSFNSPMGACQKCEGLGYLKVEDEEDEEEEIDPDLPFIPTEKLMCPSCNGTRLRKESLSVFFRGLNIASLCELTIKDLQEFFASVTLNKRESLIAERVISEIKARIGFLMNVGVEYLSLDRSADTLSGGEAQRIRLATQIGSSLVGVIYVLDEPSIGLHPKDHARLLATLRTLRDLGNTVLVVEHDQETIESADWIVDLGPGAGRMGGEVIAVGTLDQIRESPKSLTGKYLTRKLEIPIPKDRRKIDPDKTITIEGAYQNNLKDVTIGFPLGVLTCVTGVSGSGKSTLVIDTLYKALLKKLYRVNSGDAKATAIRGLDLIDKVIDVDQSPIGRTPRSNPATYTGIFSVIRDIFAQLPESQVRGYKPGRFSFNVKGGRCEDCQGDGMKKIEMHFLPNVYVQCETCRGLRYHKDTLDIRYKGKNIAEVLQMTVADAVDFFSAIPALVPKLKVLNDVGLGYIHLGQSATTLSGGEAQRIKLARELSRRSTGKTVYILDEPTTGLHFDDVNKLIKTMQLLVDQGNTVVVIEHNQDIIKVSDHVIDLGPTGGSGGGEIVAVGTPEEIANNPRSFTGQFLKPYLYQ